MTTKADEKRFVISYPNDPNNKGITSYLRVCNAEANGKSFNVFKDASIKTATRFGKEMAGAMLVAFGEPPPGHLPGRVFSATEGADLRPKSMARGRVIIPVRQIEFEDGGNTIWVQGLDGSTVLRIKTGNKIKAVSCETSPVSHTDVNAVGTIKFCLSDDAEIISGEDTSECEDEDDPEEEDDG